ncbi:MAG: peptidase C15 [Methyloceanibacter sp.]|uniref:pyroglutamyl-peptidase I family protein n=1 Tax=Methyloceanibacter sp. TaxID=1965321 RepID=UPI003D6CEC17
MARPRVLITGFGPFPGTPENPSGWLAETLARQVPDLDCDLHARVLPTEWEVVARLAPSLYESLQPHVMIHFGVSARAKTLRIERSAHNRTSPRADACGALPGARAISPGGAERLHTRLPVTALSAHLRALGYPAGASHSCGRYLCNFLYYRSLEWAEPRSRHALFVHVPPLASHGAPLAPESLLQAAQDIVRFVLHYADKREAAA